MRFKKKKKQEINAWKQNSIEQKITNKEKNKPILYAYVYLYERMDMYCRSKQKEKKKIVKFQKKNCLIF